MSSVSGQNTELSFHKSVWEVTKRTGSKTQAAKRSFLLRVDGLSVGDSTRDVCVHEKVFWACPLERRLGDALEDVNGDV